MNNWNDEWVNMPEYVNENQPKPEITATFKFRNEKDFLEFKEKVKKYIYDGQKVFDGQQTKEAKQAWFPLKEKASKYIYTSKENLKPRFPIYIVSKNRYKRNPTSKALDKMNVDSTIFEGIKIFSTPNFFAALTSFKVSLEDKCPVFKTTFFLAISSRIFFVSSVGPSSGI